MNLPRLLAMARKEAIQLRRDPRSMVLAFALPLFMLLFFGYAITWDVKNLRLVVINEDGGQHSREVVQSLEGSGYFRVIANEGDRAAGDAYLQHGRAAAVLIIPQDFTRNLSARKPAPVQLLLDGADANTATIALNYASAILARYSRDVVLAGQKLVIPVTPEPRVWYNPTLASRNMIVPGLVAVIMSIIAAMLTALTIAREWERGTMEQLAATPVGRLEVVFGKLLPYLAIGFFDVAVTIGAGMLIFGVPFHGSVLLLSGMTLLFLIGALGLGIFISAVLKSQVLATQTAMVATYLPALLLSGFLYDVRSMPFVLRAITYIVPAKYYIAVTRGVLLKGVGVHVLWVQGLSMILFAIVGLALATLSFQKRIER
ncbi:MAG TPA: ABC transporter permease [Longimicrobiales bacterium]